ncbi:hypothetical protein ACFPAF_16590 [Hymenobacter endophyticus]|uniref:Uncharacterized protein n=1 Tax=Hymenobacter endophyticus TaxID=3076335 RepID=A0ABU3TKX1_9BACT|nr:hypothetical protein [Hymenobacter endophyticus]MDU0372023.1 hypothetical protein [Hymenobacter endophyticus]
MEAQEVGQQYPARLPLGAGQQGELFALPPPPPPHERPRPLPRCCPRPRWPDQQAPAHPDDQQDACGLEGIERNYGWCCPVHYVRYLRWKYSL